MKSRQSDKKLTFQIRVDKGWWKLLSELRTEYRVPFKALVEIALTEVYSYANDRELKRLLRRLSDDE